MRASFLFLVVILQGQPTGTRGERSQQQGALQAHWLMCQQADCGCVHGGAFGYVDSYDGIGVEEPPLLLTSTTMGGHCRDEGAPKE